MLLSHPLEPSCPGWWSTVPHPEASGQDTELVQVQASVYFVISHTTTIKSDKSQTKVRFRQVWTGIPGAMLKHLAQGKGRQGMGTEDNFFHRDFFYIIYYV